MNVQALDAVVLDAEVEVSSFVLSFSTAGFST
jgi:hypothetical protein